MRFGFSHRVDGLSHLALEEKAVRMVLAILGFCVRGPRSACPSRDTCVQGQSVVCPINMILSPRELPGLGFQDRAVIGMAPQTR